MNFKKAQFAMEYILVIAVLFVMLVPGIYLYYSYSQTSLEQIASTRVSDIGNSIINNAENSYFLGKGSRITLDVSMPTGIVDMKINCITPPSPPNYCELTFTQAGSELLYSTKAPLRIKGQTEYPQSFTAEQFSGGAKKVIIETQDYVQIDIQ